jgi:hypothetical protein
LSRNWGEYLPILWNCQHFAALLAQIVVDTHESASVVRQLLGSHFNKETVVRVARHFTCSVAMAGFGLISGGLGSLLALAAWGTAGGYMATDAMKDSMIQRKFMDLAKNFPQLQKL